MTFAPDSGFNAAGAAKVVSSHAAGVIAAATHQATGAMGMTKEYELGHLTLRLASWRDECGSEAAWSRTLGESALAAGVDAFWPSIAGDGVAAGAESAGQR
jgi:acyl-CoA dehydrogenase